MKKLVTVFTFIFLLGITSITFAEVNDPTDIKELQAAYNQWIEAVTTAKGNPDKVVQLYAPDAILLATLKAKPLKTPKNIRKYFVSFTALKNLSATTDKLVTIANDDFGLNSGLYTFNYVNDEGNAVSVPARFTFVYKKIDGKWMIINHHSSATPAKIEHP